MAIKNRCARVQGETSGVGHTLLEKRIGKAAMLAGFAPLFEFTLPVIASLIGPIRQMRPIRAVFRDGAGPRSARFALHRWGVCGLVPTPAMYAPKRP